ncbi:epoxyqueuosine reductase [Mariprofundus micogutta]|uniref:Epoxyqueuosine reductase n=2 Tax=Mariprofundus micogutta TaxID=1921010 RepID=A0A1L8CRA0_9PROT|nr:epoxyqueuosine reductase [Mariprofundus micogutta]
MQGEQLKTLIRSKASQHGFDLCHVTRPEIGSKHAEALEQWVAADMQGDMSWMGEATRLERRKDPQSMLDAVKSVITLAMRYTPPAYAIEAAESACGKGVITAYAHGDDYHDVMKKRLKALALDLDLLLGKHDQRVFADTAPVLEHALAESAGLGWQGKHSLTIHREVGSWLLLGEIFTTAALQPDEPATNHCGTCSACIEICPTQAIVAPYVVDARLCISYLTIEFDGFIPRQLRAKMGNRIYGCDDCQQTCPWNQHAARAACLKNDLLNPRGENVLPDLARILQIDGEEFRKIYRKSPIKRTKRAGLLRNVCIAMGNSGDTRFISDLVAVLNDEEPLIRGHAVWALAQLADDENCHDISALLECLQKEEKEVMVHEEITHAITHIRNL